MMIHFSLRTNVFLYSFAISKLKSQQIVETLNMEREIETLSCIRKFLICIPRKWMLARIKISIVHIRASLLNSKVKTYDKYERKYGSDLNLSKVYMKSIIEVIWNANRWMLLCSCLL